MRNRPRFVLVVALLAAGAIGSVSADDAIRVRGDIEASIDFDTISFTPAGTYCLLEVEGVLVFTGSIEGRASGTTQALVFDTCDVVEMALPGTIDDVFRSDLIFGGLIDGLPTFAAMTYRGRTENLGQVRAEIDLSQGANGRLRVTAAVAVGGTYRGFVKMRGADDDSDW